MTQPPEADALFDDWHETTIRVRYELRIPQGKREAAERALATYEQKCPAATSVRGCIAIQTTADIVEE